MSQRPENIIVSSGNDDKKKWIALFLGIRFMAFRSTDVLDDDDDVLSFSVLFRSKHCIDDNDYRSTLIPFSVSRSVYSSIEA